MKSLHTVSSQIANGSFTSLHADTPDVERLAQVLSSRLMQPEVTQYLMHATTEMAELLGIAI
jgi:hypothetical protein